MVERWTVESLIGYVAPTSFLNRGVLRERAAELGTTLRWLLACDPSGAYEQDQVYTHDLARRPG